MPKPIDIPKMAFDAMESLQPLFDGAKKAQSGLATSLRASRVPEPLVQGLDNLLTMMVPTSGADALLSMAPGARVVNQPAVLNTARKAGLSVFPKTFTLLPNNTLAQFVGKRSDDLVALHEATLGRSKATPEMLAALKVRMQRSMDDEINTLRKTNPEWFADAKAKGLVDEFGRHDIKLPTTPKGIPSGTREAADKIADAKILKNREFENMRRNQARIKKATEEQLNAGNILNPNMQEAVSMARANAEEAFDQKHMFKTLQEATDTYDDNVVDTMLELGISPQSREGHDITKVFKETLERLNAGNLANPK